MLWPNIFFYLIDFSGRIKKGRTDLQAGQGAAENRIAA